MIIPDLTRVTVTLPESIVREVDARTNNRSRFVLAALERELRRAERLELRESLTHPHPEASDLAEAGLQDWADSLPDDSVSDLIDVDAGRAVKWVSGIGWKAAERPRNRGAKHPKQSPQR